MEKFREPFLEKLLRNIRVKKVKSYLKDVKIICDVGCGFDAYFLNKIKKSIITGYGIDKKVYQKTGDNLILIKASFFNVLPFQDNYFDAVTMIAVLEHLDDNNSILKEVNRILKPNGLLIITTPTPRSKKILEFFAYKLHFLNCDEIREHTQYWDKIRITETLEKLNFVIEEYKYFELRLNSITVARKVN